MPKLKIKAKFAIPSWGYTIPKAEYECDDLIDAGEWWCEKYFVAYISCGFTPALVVIEAQTAQDALDALIDNGKWNHLFVVEDDEPEEDWHRSGYRSFRYDAELIQILECEVTEAYHALD